jgi:ubiquinone/menaquinone biosynthesis C-methylase UbiE
MQTLSLDLPEIAFFGRSLAEYQLFMDIRVRELVDRRVLDCAAGPSSFAAEAACAGIDVTAVDPLYARTEAALRMTIHESFSRMFAQMRAKPGLLTYKSFPSIDAAERDRRAAAARFLADYYTGRAIGRYIAGGLPSLPFGTASFDLTLCGHLLFIYEQILDFEAHLAACLELCRVTKPGGEVRIHPLVNLQGETSGLLAPLREALVCHGISSELVNLDYAFFKGATRTLVLRLT